MSFKNVLGHLRPIELLKRAIQRDKIAHSYLFLGNEGIGKKWVALQFAKALNCLNEGVEKGMPAIIAFLVRKIDHTSIQMFCSLNPRVRHQERASHSDAEGTGLPSL